MINGIPLTIDKHLGTSYESYKIIQECQTTKHKLLEKSLKDNSKVYDIQIFDEYGNDNIIFNAIDKSHANRIYKALIE